MAKPLRSPVVGYNHNVRYHGRVFHVQSEDSGPGIPRVFTHLFYEGTILVTRKHEYDVAADEDLVRTEMQQLHKTVIKELTRGEFDAKIAAFFTARGQPVSLPDPVAATHKPRVTPAPTVVHPPVTASPVPASAHGHGHAPAPASPGQATHDHAARAAHPAHPTSAPSAVVVQGSGMVGGSTPPPSDKRSVTRPTATRPQGIPRQVPPVVKPSEMKRPPVVLSSSADGVVVQRNVVIGVGGVTPSPTARPARIRPPVPYVVREGSYALNHGAGHTPADGAPVRAAPAGATPSPSPSPVATAPAAKGGHAGVNWDHAHVAAPDRRAPHHATGSAPGESKTFGNELVSDKSLDEVILEYLSDDSETDES